MTKGSGSVAGMQLSQDRRQKQSINSWHDVEQGILDIFLPARLDRSNPQLVRTALTKDSTINEQAVCSFT